jgi:hypothetical protein
MGAPPPAVVFRSIYHGRTIYAISAWLIEENEHHVVLATVPGAECLVLVGDRHQILHDVAAGTERVESRAWERNRVLWIVPFNTLYMLGLFWHDASDQFLGYYINLQAVVQRDATGFSSLDHILDVVARQISPGAGKTKTNSKLRSRSDWSRALQAGEIRANGEHAIAELSRLIPTGWEDWRPKRAWPVAKLRIRN